MLHNGTNYQFTATSVRLRLPARSVAWSGANRNDVAIGEVRDSSSVFCGLLIRPPVEYSTYRPMRSGEVAEWSNAAVLKTVDSKGSGGSNPSLSANYQNPLVPTLSAPCYGGECSVCRDFFLYFPCKHKGIRGEMLAQVTPSTAIKYKLLIIFSVSADYYR